MKEIEHKKCLFTNLSKEVRNLNWLLIQVSWEEVDFDSEVFVRGVTLENKNLNRKQNDLLTAVIKHIPEWRRLLGCKQHYTHDYSLDVHTLSVIKKMREFPNFKKINNYDKLILLYSALLHDIEKYENEVDPEHPARGAKKSSAILFRLGFDEVFINRVYLLIKHHQLLGLLAAGKIIFSAEELLETFKCPELLDLQAMLSIADIKSVKKNESFLGIEIEKKLEEIINDLKKQLTI